MKARKKWRHIDTTNELDHVVRNQIKKDSQLQLDSNEAYTIDLQGDDPAIKGNKKIKLSLNNISKDVKKSHNILKQSKVSNKQSSEISKIKRIALNMIKSGRRPKMHLDDASDSKNTWETPQAIQPTQSYSATTLPTHAQSYNPHLDEYKNYLLLLGEQLEEENKAENESNSEYFLKSLTIKLKELLPDRDIDNLSFKTKQRLMFILAQPNASENTGLIDECIKYDGNDVEDFSDFVIPPASRSKRSLKRKTKTDRNRKIKSKLIEIEERRKRQAKELNRNIDLLDNLIKECEEEDKIKEERNKNKHVIKQVASVLKKRGLIKLKQANRRYWPKSINDVSLQDEFDGSLRRLKPKSAVRSLHTNLIEKGLINIPPKIDASYEYSLKYNLITKERASKLVDRSRDFKKADPEASKIPLIDVSNEPKKEITSLL